MLLTLMLLYEQSGSVQKDPHGLHQIGKNVCMNEISWSWKQYVQRTHRIGVNLNDFATKLTVRSRSQRNLNYKQSFTENKNDSRHTWQTINQLTSRPRSRPFKNQLNGKVHYEVLNYCLIVAKYNVFATSVRNGVLDFDSFLLRLNNKIDILRTIAFKSNRLSQFKKTWDKLL